MKVTGTGRGTVLVVLVLLGAILAGACTGDGDVVPVRTVSLTRTILPPTATPTATARPSPTPTPTAAPVLGRSEAEGLVWRRVSTCAEELAAASGAAQGALSVTFTSTFNVLVASWEVEVATTDRVVTLGLWEVQTRSGEVTPKDDTAADISSANVRCAPPSVLLRGQLTPPRIFVVEPTPTATPTAVPVQELLISTAELTAAQVWVTVYECYEDFPDFSSFTGRQGIQNTWIVEGRSGLIVYGLWQVNAVTGEVMPLDDRAQRALEACGLRAGPVVVTSEQATIRVWVATYDCFTPHQPLNVFTAAQESPRQWIVEGRGAVNPQTGFADLYGLWLVDTDSGVITGHDTLAVSTRQQSCFKSL